jgi:methylmalonyl-CoA/ethylmalonyl-CoA epimerase
MPLRVQHPVVQNAYYVPDLDFAIQHWHKALGIGPFFVCRHIVITGVQHRGKPSAFSLSAAFVHAGGIQIELITQHDDAPSMFRDMYPADRQGFHHCAVMPADPEALARDYAEQGFSVVTSFRGANGSGAYYVDTRPMLGHMIEIYIASDSLRAHYRDVAAAAAGWDGKELIVEFARTF